MEPAGRCDKDIISKCHPSGIQNHQTVVCVEILPDFDPVSVITPEIRLDMDIGPAFSQNRLDKTVPFLNLFYRQAVIFLAEALTPQPLCFQFFIMICIIEQLLLHFFFLCHESIPLCGNHFTYSLWRTPQAPIPFRFLFQDDTQCNRQLLPLPLILQMLLQKSPVSAVHDP